MGALTPSPLTGEGGACPEPVLSTAEGLAEEPAPYSIRGVRVIPSGPGGASNLYNRFDVPVVPAEGDLCATVLPETRALHSVHTRHSERSGAN